MDFKKATIDEILKIFDYLYQKSRDGITAAGGIMKIPSAEQLAAEYLARYSDKQKAAKAMMRSQIAKCTTSGFITGLGGLITLPVAIPANVGSVLFVQMQMITCTAYMGGYDLNSDIVQMFTYACLVGVSLNEVMKKFGIEFGKKVTVGAIKKIPIDVIRIINRKIGFLFITKFGETGLVNLGKLVPVVGAAINGGFDYAQTKALSVSAYKMFINNDFTEGENIEDIEIIDVDYVNVDEKERALDQDSPSDND